MPTGLDLRKAAQKNNVADVESLIAGGIDVDGQLARMKAKLVDGHDARRIPDDDRDDRFDMREDRR